MSKSVLVAEDSATQAELLRSHLEDSGYAVTVAYDGQAALEELRKGSFDIVVSDVVMPGVSGYHLAHRAKRLHPDIRVLLLTALSDSLDVVRALQSGADGLLPKPYERRQLLDRVAALLHPASEQAPSPSGLEVALRGQRFVVSARPQQMLDLLVGTFQDLVETNALLADHERRLAEVNAELSRQLAAADTERARLNAVLEAAPAAMVVVDEQGRVTAGSNAVATLVGVAGVDELRGERIAEMLRFIRPDGAELPMAERPLSRAVARGESVEMGASFDLLVERADGSRAPILAYAAPVRDASGKVTGGVGMLHEIDALAVHDPLTGLPTQAGFADRVHAAIDVSAEHDEMAAVLVIAPDRFQRVRDSVGSIEADQLVTAMAVRLQAGIEAQANAHPATSAAYLGNHEFAVVLPRVRDEAAGVRAAEVLHRHVAGTYRVGGLDLPLTASVGVSLADAKTSVADLVSTAAAAAHDAGHRGGDRVQLSDVAAFQRAAKRLREETDLRRAIATGELSVHYQPLVGLSADHVASVEALVRWHVPGEPLRQPDSFIPLAEETGLIVPLGWWVLDEACHQVARWRQELPGGAGLTLNVNMSAQQLAQPDAAERVRAALAHSGLDAPALQLEITESGVMDDPGDAAERLHALRALGIRIAVDDFGTGYSSLLQLRRLPVDVLKVDRAFVAGMTEQDEDAAIVAGTVRLGHALGLEVVAEGVENLDQLVRLRALGCDTGQGFHWTRPLAGDAFQRWWRGYVAAPDDCGTRTGPELHILSDLPDDEEMAYVVHALRSPLTSIRGVAELLRARDGGDEEQLQRSIDAILRSADELNNRLGMLTQVRAARTGRLSLRMSVRPIADLVADIVADTAAQLAPHDVRLNADPALRANVDAERITQAVRIMLSNAAKFSPPDAPIEVSVERDDTAVAISVRDYGTGVPAERRTELFHRFARLGSRTKGMGIGLYLAQVIARAHRGHMRYQPGEGGGSMFTLLLPQAQAESEQVSLPA